MIGIDTNVLVRYIIQDDPQQSAEAVHFLEKECSSTNSGFINNIVLCELIWVLETAYDYPRDKIVLVLETLFRTRQFHIDKLPVAWAALRDYKNIAGDFADYFICHLNEHNSCKFTITFDKKAARIDGFKLLSKN